LTLQRVPTLAYNVLQLNSTHKPFDNQQVRQALSCAIDRQQVIDTAALGEGKVTGPNTIPLYAGNTADLPCYKPDLDKAKQLLTAAGMGSGFSFDVIASTTEPANAVNEAQNIAAQLSKIGVTMNIKPMDNDAYVKAWLAADFDAAIALNGGRADPHLMFIRYWSSKGNLNKVAAYSDSTLDDLLAQGQKETDPAKRVTVYQDFAKHLVDESPWIWLYNGYNYVAMQDKVQGYIGTPLVSISYLRQTWLNQ
jgi:peptide/nickel transport system substrate-binding protein